MSDHDAPAPPQDERIMAALSHGSVMIPYVGIVAPIIVWVTQKDTSRYVAFHALQAMAYQLTMLLLFMISMGCYMCSGFGMIGALAAAEAGGASGPAAGLAILPVLVPFGVMGLMLLGALAFVGYALVGAVRVLRGKPFRYAIIGKKVERYLKQAASADAQTAKEGAPQGPHDDQE